MERYDQKPASCDGLVYAGTFHQGKTLYLIRLHKHGLPCDRVRASAATLCTDSALWQHHNQPGVRGPQPTQTHNSQNTYTITPATSP